MYTINNLEQYNAYATKISKTLNLGDCLGLVGQLGAGKTTLVQTIGRSLRIEKPILSPTYVFAKEYSLPKGRLIHIDAYRVNLEQADSIGLSDYLDDPENLVIIEWADKVRHQLPQRTKWIEIIVDGNHRLIKEDL